MKILSVSILFALLAVPSGGYSFDSAALPDSLGSDPVLPRSAEIQTWKPEHMFEHVNGEAELLIRYGAVSLTFVSYEHESGDYLSVDLLDLGEPINAYGLYRLYTGCDGEERNVRDALVLADEYTAHSFLGQYFLRINIDTSDNERFGSGLVSDFLTYFSEQLPGQPSAPPELEILTLHARTPCEVNYHPEHIDYDLETGPGYSWVGQDGSSYAVLVLDSEAGAEVQFKTLQNKGVQNLLLFKTAVIWKASEEEGSAEYMKTIIREIVEK